LNTLKIIGRKNSLFLADIEKIEAEMTEVIQSSRFLVLGGAGSIGQAVTKEIFLRQPRKLDVVDISENNLVELVRDIRSSPKFREGDLETFSIDIGSLEFDAFYKFRGQYDYVLNLSALKHVRSEKDPFTLMRMLDVNINNTNKTINQAIESGVTKYFCVSTDKAANPVNMMGASKKIMEMYLMKASSNLNISTARFANVAFSDGSLLYGFEQRFRKNQPLVAPVDIKRYFLTSEEAGQLCILSCIFGNNRDIFFPKLSKDFTLTSLSDVLFNFVDQKGYDVQLCESEHEARELSKSLPNSKSWPCFLSKSDTTGEKSFEEFYTGYETLDMSKYKSVGIIKNVPFYDTLKLQRFDHKVSIMRKNMNWSKQDIVDLFKFMLPDFDHVEVGKYLDSKM